MTFWRALLVLVLLAAPAAAQEPMAPPPGTVVPAVSTDPVHHSIIADPSASEAVKAVEKPVIPVPDKAAALLAAPVKPLEVSPVALAAEEAAPAAIALPTDEPAPQGKAAEEAAAEDKTVEETTTAETGAEENFAPAPVPASPPVAELPATTKAKEPDATAIEKLLNAPASQSTPDGFKTCTKKWCTENLTLNFHGADDAPLAHWPLGRYQFLVDIDGAQRVICLASLPLSADCQPAVSCNHPGVTIGLAGCGGRAEEQGFTNLTVTPIPNKIDVLVTYQSGANFRVRNDFIRPQCTFPNGEECDARPCCNAVMDKTVKVKWE